MPCHGAATRCVLSDVMPQKAEKQVLMNQTDVESIQMIMMAMMMMMVIMGKPNNPVGRKTTPILIASGFNNEHRYPAHQHK